jgi:hypothetical protein
VTYVFKSFHVWLDPVLKSKLSAVMDKLTSLLGPEIVDPEEGIVH